MEITLLSNEFINDLFEFEQENRDYFNRIGLGRPDEYYNKEKFKEIVEEHILQQKEDIHYMYLIFNDDGKLVGRMNLVEIVRGPLNKAEVGYRISKNEQGKKYATLALNLKKRAHMSSLSSETIIHLQYWKPEHNLFE